ncbi:MAG: tryptophan synthase subunit alpha [Dehalococcoidia bacterium]|nr:MAG: tryptophan synthase subunit alpha [Dehalococcoidia bacterium]
MSRIASVFSRRDRKALIPYVTVGYPTIEATLKVVPLLAQNGADIVELGIPFSDPLADGVTIQRSSFHALQKGVTPQICLDVAKKLRAKVDIPLVFMTYYNPVFHYGLEEFCSACVGAGIDGLIIPDLPPQEGADLEAITKKQDLDLIYLLAPTSPEERIKLVGQRSRGFIYLVSVTGVTGARDKLPADLEVFVTRVRELVAQPLCVGFGISTPSQAKRVARLADGVIVGSRIIQLMESGDMPQVGEFVKGLRNALG